MRIGIVGAGISGLAAGRTLKAAGHEVVIFEKSGGVGGRISTRRQDGFTWDTGATSIAPRGKFIERVMLEELSTEGLEEVKRPIYVHAGLRISPGDAGRTARRYTYVAGNTQLPKRLAEGLDVRLNATVEGLERRGKGFAVCWEEFDGVILTPPVPQTSALLWTLGESRPLANARYRPCLSILLGFHVAVRETAYHALLDPEQRHPMTWLSIESAKCSGRAPEGGTAFCMQMSPAFSLERYEQADESLVRSACGFLERLYGPEFAEPASWTVKRWKYSQPEMTASFENVNQDARGLVIAGDGLAAGRVEEAYEVGVLAAQRVVRT